MQALRVIWDGLLVGPERYMRASSTSISASGVTGIVNGRIAVPSAEPVETGM